MWVTAAGLALILANSSVHFQRIPKITSKSSALYNVGQNRTSSRSDDFRKQNQITFRHRYQEEISFSPSIRQRSIKIIIFSSFCRSSRGLNVSSQRSKAKWGGQLGYQVRVAVSPSLFISSLSIQISFGLFRWYFRRHGSMTNTHEYGGKVCFPSYIDKANGDVRFSKE